MPSCSKLLVIGYTADVSGSSVALSRLLAAIRPQVPFTVVASPESYLASHARACGWDYREIPVPLLKNTFSPVNWVDFIFKSFRLSLRLRRLFLQERHGALLVNCAPNLGWIPGWLLLPAALRPPVYWLVHELTLKPALVYAGIRRIIRKFAAEILCVSEPVSRLFPAPTQLLPNIVPLTGVAKLENPFQQDKVHLLWTGTAGPRKGLHHLTQLVRRFLALDTPVRLEVIASVSPKYRDYFTRSISALRQLDIALEVRENVEEIMPFYNSSKILLQHSVLPESFGLTVLEAMSRGMLVFASGRGGIRDFGSHSENLIFLEESGDDLPGFISRLAGDSAAVRKIQENALTTAKKYSPQIIGLKLADLLEFHGG